MKPLDLIRAAPWEQALFTTYALSLAFFEAVLLDALMRGGSKQALIMTDPEGLRAALSEHGATRAGREYELEPVGCTTGCFHPKISALVAGRDAHLLVGSGNLSFGGWGGNLECIDHLHPSFAAGAFNDAADLFELMTMDATIVFDAQEACLRLAETLRRAATGAPADGRIRLAHSLGTPIGAQLKEFADELGGAKRLRAASPYYDLDGRGIDRLARELGCDEILLHAHRAGAVRGVGAVEWPFDASRVVTPVRFDETFPADHRLLHAKCFEIQCRRGAIRVAGSANATQAGLFGGNVEASVVRILPGFKRYWTASPAEPPVRSDADEEVEAFETDSRVGIVRATLEGDRLLGRVITPRISGSAETVLETAAGERKLGPAAINGDGRFEIAAPGIEVVSFKEGRLVLRLLQGERILEGIVAVAAAAELTRRVGAMAPKLMAMLAGSETPADVAAILSWFHDDPARLPRDIRGRGNGDGSDGGDVQMSFVTLAELEETAAREPASPSQTGGGNAAWKGAVALLKAALRSRRGPITSGGGSEEGDEDPAQREQRALEEEQQNTKSLGVFDELLPIMLEAEREGRDALMALALAHFLADRIRPSPAKLREWLGQIMPQIRSFDGSDGPLAIEAALVSFASDDRPDAATRARQYLVQRGADPAALPRPGDQEGAAFAELLAPGMMFDHFVAEIRVARTPGEQVAAYLAAARGEGPRSGYPLLERSPHWSRLARGLDDPVRFARFEIIQQIPRSCPRCRIALPVAASEELRDTGVTCCCSVILHGEL